MEPRPFVFNEALGKPVVEFSMADAWGRDVVANNYYLEFPDENTAITHGVLSSELQLDSDSGCYKGYSSGYNRDFELCKTRNGFRLNDRNNFFVAYFSYDEEHDKYVLSDTLDVFFILNEVTDDQATLTMYLPISYDDEIEKYYIALPMAGGFGVFAERRDTTILATEFLFRDKVEGNVVPEDIPENIANPQTGDIAFKTILIMLAGITPIAITSKRLIKR